MNTKIEDLKKMQELFGKMTNEDKELLNTLLLACKEEYVVDPLGTIERCIQEMVKCEMGMESIKESDVDYDKLLSVFSPGSTAREGRKPVSGVTVHKRLR